MAGLNRITGSTFNKAPYNENLDAFEAQSTLLLGMGVISGMLLSDTTGLTLAIASGAMNVKKYKTYAGGTATVPNNATSYVWISEDGLVTFSATSAYPGGNVVGLGTVSATAGDITAVSNVTGRMYAALRMLDERTIGIGGQLFRIDTLNGWIGVGKTPTAAFDIAVALTSDSSAVFGSYAQAAWFRMPQQLADPATPTNAVLFYSKEVSSKPEAFMKNEDGTVTQVTSLGSIIPSINVETISANKTGAAADALIQVLTPSGAHRKYILPPADPTKVRRIHNGATSGAFDIQVRNPADSTTLATLTNGQMVTIEPRIGGSYASGDYASSYTPDP